LLSEDSKIPSVSAPPEEILVKSSLRTFNGRNNQMRDLTLYVGDVKKLMNYSCSANKPEHSTFLLPWQNLEILKIRWKSY